MDALGIERAHLVGNSMGGRVALEVGLREPDARRRPGAAVPGAGLRAPRLPAARAAAAPGARPAAALARPRPDRAPVLVDVRRPRPRRPERGRHRRSTSSSASTASPGARLAFLASARSIYLDPPFGRDGPVPAPGGARAAGDVRLGLARQADPARLRPPRRALAARAPSRSCSRAAATCRRSSAPSARTACSRASSRASTRSAPRRSSASRPNPARERGHAEQDRPRGDHPPRAVALGEHGGAEQRADQDARLARRGDVALTGRARERVEDEHVGERAQQPDAQRAAPRALQTARKVGVAMQHPRGEDQRHGQVRAPVVDDRRRARTCPPRACPTACSSRSSRRSAARSTIASREPRRPTSENTAATMISAPASASALGRSPRKRDRGGAGEQRPGAARQRVDEREVAGRVAALQQHEVERVQARRCPTIRPNATQPSSPGSVPSAIASTGT